MSQLKWNEYAFVECLEVLPTVDDYATEHRFTVVQPDLTLVLIVWQCESVVEIQLNRTETDLPVMHFVLVVRGGTRHCHERNVEWLEFLDVAIVPDRFSYLDCGYDRIKVDDPRQMPGIAAVRLFIKPGIRIELARTTRAR